MAISRFETPADYTPINTYVPLPYQEIALGLQQKQKRYDDNEEMQFKLENLIKTIKADPNRQFMLKELDDEYFSKIDDLASTIHDKGDMRYKSELRKIAGKFQTDERVRNLNTSYANYGKYQEDAMKNKEKMTDFYDSYKQDAQSIEQMKKAGIATPTFNYNGMLYKQDYVKDMDDLVRGIAKDGLAKEGYLTYPKGHPQAGELMINDYGQYTKNGKSWEGVSVDKVKQIADLSVDPFLSKDSSRYFVDQLYGKQTSYDELTPEQKTNVRNAASQTMKQIAAKQVFGDSKYTTDLANLSKYATDKLEDKENNSMQMNTYDSGSYNTEYQSVLPKFEFKNGNIAIPDKPKTALEKNPYKAAKIGLSQEDLDAAKLEEKKYNEQKVLGIKGANAQINNLYSRYGLPDDPKLTPEQKYKAVQETEKSLQNQTRNMLQGSLSSMKYLGDLEIKHGDLSGRQIKVPGKNFKNFEQVTEWLADMPTSERGKYIPKDVPNTQADIATYLNKNVQVTGIGAGMGIIDKDDKGAKASYEIKTPSGFKMAVSANKQTQNALRPIHYITQQIMDPLSNRTPIPISDRQGNLKGYYKVNIKDGKSFLNETDEKGNIIDDRPVEPQIITNYVMEEFKNSPYINSVNASMKKSERDLRESYTNPEE